jgi:hypothetical protein
MFDNLKRDVRLVFIIALAIVAAVVLWQVVTFVTAVLFKLVLVAILAAIVYVGFLLLRSSLRGNRKGSI